MNHALTAYKTDSILTLNEKEILLRLYERLFQRIDEAEEALTASRRADLGIATGKALDIVGALRAALRSDLGAEVIPQLHQLYEAVTHWLMEGNRTQDAKCFANCRRVLEPLHDGWTRAIASLAS